MTDLEVFADLVDDLTRGIHKQVSGLSQQELTWQPDPSGNIRSGIFAVAWMC